MCSPSSFLPLVHLYLKQLVIGSAQMAAVVELLSVGLTSDQLIFL